MTFNISSFFLVFIGNQSESEESKIPARGGTASQDVTEVEVDGAAFLLEARGIV